MLVAAREENEKGRDNGIYVRRIRSELGPATCREVARGLWAVALADGHIDPQEEKMVRAVIGQLGFFEFEATELREEAIRCDALIRREP